MISNVLPRCAGSKTICVNDACAFATFVLAGVTVILMVQRFAASPCCSASIDQFQSGSSSKGASGCEVRLTTPDTTSAIFDWHNRIACDCC